METLFDMAYLEQALIYGWLVASVLLCTLIRRLSPGQVRAAVRLYLPVFVLAFAVLASRIITLPGEWEEWTLPSLMAFCCCWQLLACRRLGRAADIYDRSVAWLSFFALLAMALLSFSCHRTYALPMSLWWITLLTYVASVWVLYVLTERYYKPFVFRRAETEGKSIRITWFYDLLKMTVFPVLFMAALPLSIARAFHLAGMSEEASTLIFKPFVKLVSAQGEPNLTISLYMLLVAVSLIFLFRYLSYFIKSWYAIYKRIRTGVDEEHTLANNLIAVLVWFIYVVVTVHLLDIPTGAIAMVGTGLAAGIGLAMKDIINNFIYGIQLMSGRLKVGDWIVCDGMRGRVTAISYQSTQIQTLDGGVVSFLNANLFTKNFKNLTRSDAYEFVKIVFGVCYGMDVEQVRSVVLKAVNGLKDKDDNGVDVVDPSKGFTVTFDDFGESSVNVAVKCFVLVPLKASYTAKLQEVIYKALGEAGIEIPFPQRDIHMR